MQIDAHKRTLGEVLQFGQHMIPRYQRRYAWEEQNLRDFWNDITNSDQAHFLGSMVTSGATSEPREVIDGQQRLTTTIIALCVLRDHYQSRGHEDRVTGINAFLEFNDRNGVKRTRLQNRDGLAANRLNDNAILPPARREGAPSYDPECNEAQAYAIFDTLTTEALGDSATDIACLDSIRDSILESEVVYINVEDRKSAFTIFETLNDRGLSLTVMDLVKNLLFASIVESDEDSSDRLWSDMLGLVEQLTLEGISADGFLYYAWNSRDNEGHSRADTIENARLRRSIDDQLSTAADKAEFAQSLVQEIHRDAQILAALNLSLTSNGKPESWQSFDPDWRRDKYEEVSERVYGILVTGSNQPLPLLLALLRAYFHKTHPMNRKLLLNFLGEIERFQFRWTISQKSSTSSIRRLYRLAAASVSGASTTADVQHALNTFVETSAKLDASDAQFRDGVSRLAYSRTRIRDSFKIRHILTRIERSSSTTHLDLSRQMSIEHLQGLEGRSEQTPRNAWIFKIGNLTLIPPEVNAKLPKDFAAKCTDLSDWVNPADTILREALAERDWRSDRSGERLDWIVRRALALWPRVTP